MIYHDSKPVDLDGDLDAAAGPPPEVLESCQECGDPADAGYFGTNHWCLMCAVDLDLRPVPDDWWARRKAQIRKDNFDIDYLDRMDRIEQARGRVQAALAKKKWRERKLYEVEIGE